MSQVDFRSTINPSHRAVTRSAALAVTALPAATMSVAGAEFAEPDSRPDTPELLRDIRFFVGSTSEADFELQLQEFCHFARLGFTILTQSKPRLLDVTNLLRSIGDGNAADDLLELVISGRDKAELLLELTTAAKLRYESAVLNAARPPAK
jgi:hypothetical protein